MAERREGQRVYYHLVNPELSEWLLQSLDFLELQLQQGDRIQAAVAQVREVWELPDSLA